jgi:hypothetical protein
MRPSVSTYPVAASREATGFVSLLLEILDFRIQDLVINKKVASNEIVY